MKISDMSTNGVVSEKRISVTGSAPSNGNPALNASSSDDSPVMMNKPEMASRGSRADALVEMAGNDSYSLATEAPRMGKMKG